MNILYLFNSVNEHNTVAAAVQQHELPLCAPSPCPPMPSTIITKTGRSKYKPNTLSLCDAASDRSSFLLLQGFNQEDLEGDKKETGERQQLVEEESDSDEDVDRSGQE